jgi:CRISPR-associated protein Csb1
VYAVEQRRVFDESDKLLPEPKTCVILDTVQSQANRMELALQEAVDNGKLKMPLVVVDFSRWSPTGDVEADKAANRLIEAVGKITSLQVPHRLADAILRYSQTPDGVEFRKSEKGKALDTASPQNATPLYQLCPTALIFGMWDSTGPKGGLGAKFERALVSEVVGVGASFGVKTSSRIDPLITKTEGIVLYKTPGGSWTLKPDEAKKDQSGKPILYGKKGKVSDANLGNVTPDFDRYDQKSITGENRMTPDPMRSDGGFIEANRIRPGGVTIEYAEQVTTLSLIVLRRLRFPLNGTSKPETDVAARTVLAALGLCAATLAFENGMGLRSRCLLWPEGPMQWELLDKPGEAPKFFPLTGDAAVSLFNAAVNKAKEAGLTWEVTPITLLPQQKLVDLVRQSQIEATKESSEKGG